jgi:hypothetical protein
MEGHTSMKKTIRPYELTGPRYALWYDCGDLGVNIQTAVGNYLCGDSDRITLPHGQLDQRSRMLIKTLATKRGVLIAQSAL